MHTTMQRIPMLNDLREGLNMYNLVSVLEQKPEHCRGLFIIGNDEKVDAHYIISNLEPVLSEKGTLKHTKEVEILNYLQDFLNEIEGKVWKTIYMLKMYSVCSDTVPLLI